MENRTTKRRVSGCPVMVGRGARGSAGRCVTGELGRGPTDWQEVARAALALRELAAALRRVGTVPDAARELGVPLWLVEVRLRHLHPAERALLRRHLVG